MRAGDRTPTVSFVRDRGLAYTPRQVTASHIERELEGLSSPFLIRNRGLNDAGPPRRQLCAVIEARVLVCSVRGNKKGGAKKTSADSHSSCPHSPHQEVSQGRQEVTGTTDQRRCRSGVEWWQIGWLGSTAVHSSRTKRKKQSATSTRTRATSSRNAQNT